MKEVTCPSVYTAEDVERQHANWTTEPSNIEAKNKILSLVPEDVESVLDYGCGTGRYSEPFKNYFGFDRCKHMIEFAKKTYPNKRFGMELPDEKFDLVFMVSVVQYWSDGEFESVIKEACEHSKKYVLIQTWDKECGRTNKVSGFKGVVGYGRNKNKYLNVLQKYGDVERIVLNREPGFAFIDSNTGKKTTCAEDSFKVIYLLRKM